MKIRYLLGALALTMSTASFAAASEMDCCCCKMECCKDKDCCKDEAAGKNHAKHDMGHKYQ